MKVLFTSDLFTYADIKASLAKDNYPNLSPATNGPARTSLPSWITSTGIALTSVLNLCWAELCSRTNCNPS